MKLRNKRTGEIVERVDITIREVGVVFNNDETYNSLAELSEEWEDYTSKEPLIKDEKIRKAVRMWAEACGLKEANFTQGCVFQFGWSEIDFGSNIDENIATGHYTIAELCGEAE